MPITKKKPLTLERLNELLKYDEETGVFTWKNRTSKKLNSNKIAGSLTSKGYRSITIDGYHYYASHLVILLNTGKLPLTEVDHIDGNRSNNRRDNLRVVSRSQNLFNKKKIRKQTNPELPRGVSKYNGKFFAQLGKDGKNNYAGYYDTVDEARAAYLNLVKKLYGDDFLANILIS